jgi:RNA polymerase sigma factor (TIGR02999 family)
MEKRLTALIAARSADLLPLVYDQLRRLAAARLAREGMAANLQATSLVHEAYLRLVGDGSGPLWDTPGHFFAAAAEAMRRILIEEARRRRSLKGGGNFTRVPLTEGLAVQQADLDQLLTLDDALERLAADDPLLADVARLRLFAGLTLQDIAESLGISTTVAHRSWGYARAFLRQELSE